MDEADLLKDLPDIESTLRTLHQQHGHSRRIMTEKVEEYRKQIVGKEGRITELQNKVANVEEQVKGRGRRIAVLTGQVATQEQKIKEQAKQIAQIVKENVELKEEKERLQTIPTPGSEDRVVSLGMSKVRWSPNH